MSAHVKLDIKKPGISARCAASNGIAGASLRTAAFPLFPGTNSPVPLSIARSTNGSLELTITSQVGSNYVVEASTNFAAWTAVYTNVATSTNLHFTDTNTSPQATWFYRAFAL